MSDARALILLAAFASLAAAQTPEELIEGGHFKRLRAMVEPRFKSNANDAHNNYLMGRVRRAFGDLEAAMKLFEKAVELAPKNAEYHSQLGQTYGEIAQNASVFRQMGLGRKCKKEIDTAVALDPNNIEAQVTLMMFLDKAPGMMGGDKSRAKAIGEELVKTHGGRGYLAQARLVSDAGAREDLFKKALALNPRLFNAHINLANQYVNVAPQKLEAAEKHAREAIRIDPARVQPYAILAAVYAIQDRMADTAKVLDEAVKNVPDNLYPYYNTARVLIGKGKHPDQAEAYLRKYLEQEPEAAMPQHALAYWSLGQLFEKQGKRTEALAALRQAVKLKPDFEPAKKDLNRLQKG